jgi:hypothetical protein
MGAESNKGSDSAFRVAATGATRPPPPRSDKTHTKDPPQTKNVPAGTSSTPKGSPQSDHSKTTKGPSKGTDWSVPKKQQRATPQFKQTVDSKSKSESRDEGSAAAKSDGAFYVKL